jgi:hypothetical protein
METIALILLLNPFRVGGNGNDSAYIIVEPLQGSIRPSGWSPPAGGSAGWSKGYIHNFDQPAHVFQTFELAGLLKGIPQGFNNNIDLQRQKNTILKGLNINFFRITIIQYSTTLWLLFIGERYFYYVGPLCGLLLFNPSSWRVMWF